MENAGALLITHKNMPAVTFHRCPCINGSNLKSQGVKEESRGAADIKFLGTYRKKHP